MSSGVTTVHQRRGASLVVRSADVKVQMDNFADPFATVLRIKTPSDLGDLGEMTSSIKKLGLNVVKASVWTETQARDQRGRGWAEAVGRRARSSTA